MLAGYSFCFLKTRGLVFGVWYQGLTRVTDFGKLKSHLQGLGLGHASIPKPDTFQEVYGRLI